MIEEKCPTCGRRNDGTTWARKHEKIHEIQKLLGLSNTSTANFLAMPEKSLNEVIEKLKEKIKCIS
jgi:DNA-directed RNA polymerase alpha subunit